MHRSQAKKRPASAARREKLAVSLDAAQTARQPDWPSADETWVSADGQSVVVVALSVFTVTAEWVVTYVNRETCLTWSDRLASWFEAVEWPNGSTRARWKKQR